ncbi:MAG: adenylate kinase family protein [Euryarchaeota archaeon]|nr:adenylate kinase family protein [Euryarchaeota archaeon]
MLIALTGTPGTGKTTVGTELMSRGIPVHEVSDIAKEKGLLKEKDIKRDSYDIDPDELDEAVDHLRGDERTVLVGHLAHLVDADIVIVLRCRPSVLEERLASRGWSPKKVRENAEAEAVDTILIEALELNDTVYELDTTEMDPVSVAEAVFEILDGKTDKYGAGNIDWSDEVLKWY